MIWKEPAITAYYLGYYDGSIRFKPIESSCFRVSSLEEIEEEMKITPELFTQDMFFILKNWKKLIISAKEIK